MARKVRTSALTLPGRHWLYRATLIMMVTLGLALMVMSKTNNPAIGRLRTSVTDIMTPVLAVASSPMDAISSAGTWLNEAARMREENLVLKAQNAQLLQWQSAAKDMETENRSLRALLNVVPAHKAGYITVRVVSDFGGPYMHSALISGGVDNGIKKDQAVINEKGLMGRVVDAGATSARVLLLNDINSRVPVIAERTQEKGILAGNNTDLPSLSYLAADSRIQVGDRIVSSGDGGVFPKGIPVGVVTAIDSGAVKVQPFVDSTTLEYVSVVDYSL